MSTENLPGTTVTLQAEFPGGWSLADLQQRLGNVSAERIRMFPPPGCATEEDVIEIQAHEDRLYELEDGVLVEKAMGWYESIVAGLILTAINTYLKTHDLGKAFGADAPLKMLSGIVKIPDVAFVSWQRWPKEKMSRRPIPVLVPDLAVEVISESNTKNEMDQKLGIYFTAGVQLVWYIDPKSRTARAYRSLIDYQELDERDMLDGGQVLPDFHLDLFDLFAEADRNGPRESN